MFHELKEYLLAVERESPVATPSLLGIHGILLAAALGIDRIRFATRLPSPQYS